MDYFIDTHTHLYLEQFAGDRKAVVQQALDSDVRYMLLPNVDEETIEPLLELHSLYPENCLPMLGLHPTSVKPGFENILSKMKTRFTEMKFYAIGETGIDLYWDKTHFDLQVQSFRIQIEWALEYNLPVVIHARNSVQQIMDVLEPYRNNDLTGVMHCFPGTVEDANWFVNYGLHLGIGGVVTYKNSEMAKVAEQISLEYLILETDAPYLPPVPHRGKRNEPSYIPVIAARLAQIKGIDLNEVAEITTRSAKKLFNIS
jgi:TatD DNase family protein